MKLAASLAASAFLLAAAVPPMSFTPAEPAFMAAAEEYRRLWCDEGPRIVQALEEATGQSFPATPIEVFVANATPMTTYDGRTMLLKASYPTYYKRATLVHELGHRLAFTMNRPEELDDHRLLYLFLYDVWSRLYGADFADRMAQIESRITGRYDYAGAWKWALALTPEQRRERIAKLRPAAPAPPTPAPSNLSPVGCV
ncbi:MAG TPA: hypothetical protein VEZ41_10580 [Allosphingosinicella sp.]|nr:hypothetical protein [Allosphingosinicella sp.]